MSERIEVRLPDGIARLSDMFCGCGCPTDAWEWVRDYLRLCTKGEYFPAKTGAEWVALYTIDHVGLTEHGTSICGSWLTDDGEAALAFLEQCGADWQEDETHDFVDGNEVSHCKF